MMKKFSLTWNDFLHTNIAKSFTRLRDAFKKKNSIWRDIVPTRGGGGKKTFEMSLLKIPIY